MFSFTTRALAVALMCAAVLACPALAHAAPPKPPPQQQQNRNSAGSLQFANASVSANEGAGRVTLTVQRVGGSSGAVSVRFASANGTAVAPADYTAVSGTLHWANGDSSPKTITIPIIDDHMPEPNETFTVVLSNPSGRASLGANATATVTIIDNDAAAPVPQRAGTIQFSTISAAVREDVGRVSLTVQRVGGSSGAVSVRYATVDGSATAPSDYVAASGTLSWADGDSGPKTINVTIVNDNIPEPVEMFRVVLSNVTGGATLGADSTYTITIVDDDAVPTPQPQAAGTLQFASAAVSANEGVGRVSLTVQRVGGSSGAVSVRFASANGTAVAPADYGAVSGTLNWADGDSGPKTISVSIVDDNIVEPDETFRVVLTNATGGATLGTNAVTVTIVDNDVRLELEIRTSDDDLRGGNDNLNVEILFSDGTSQSVPNINGGQKWDNYTTHTPTVALRAGKTAAQISGIRLSTTFMGGVGGDNWNMERIEVRAVTSRSSQVIKSYGYKRFTGSDRELLIR